MQISNHIKSDSHEQLKSLNTLRGLFALEIIIGHVVRHENTPLSLLGKFMICSVAYFFFVSAFGLVESYKRKKYYLNIKTFIKKPIYLILLSLAIYLLGLFVSQLTPFDVINYSDKNFISRFFLSTNWYIWEQAFFYICFYLVYKYLYQFRLVSICIITLIASLVVYFLSAPPEYAASSFAFPFGILYAEKYEKINTFIYSFKGLILFIPLLCFGLSYLFVTKNSFISDVFMRNSICLAALIIINPISSIKINDYQSNSEAKTKSEQKIETIKKGIKP